MNKLLLCLLACFTLNATETAKLTLSNGLKAYIISDPAAKKSAAALSVNAGSWQDPKEHPGIAHFLEHMLFLGTKSHPEEDGFFDFIKRHGGQSNAFTEDLYTTYIFDINTPFFKDALSYLSEFFYEPLLTPSGSEREIEAITQEFHGHSQGDDARRLQVYKALGNKKHPWTKFNYGNKESLNNTTAAELKTWMEEHYSSDKMLLTVYSPIPIDELKRVTEKNFSKVPLRQTKNLNPPSNIFDKSTENSILFIKPLTQKRSLSFLWQLPHKFASAYDTRPEEIICAVLGHEGKGTLLDHLKESGLAYELDCGSYRWSDLQMAFVIEIELTQLGVKKYEEVISLLFSYLNELENKPLPISIFEDLQKVQRQKALFPKRETSYKEVIQKSKELRFESLETYPMKTKVIQKYDADLVKELWKTLNPKDVRIDLMMPEEESPVEFDQTEKWMHIHYRLEPRSTISITPLPTAHFPEKNSFISEDFSLITSSQEGAKELLSTEYGKLFIANAAHFQTPKSALTFRVQSPDLAYNTAKNVARAELWTLLAESMLTRNFYSAKQANLEYKITYDNRGYFLTVWGFSEKTGELLEQIITKLKDFKPTEKAFKKQSKRLKSKYQSQLKKVPYEQSFRLLKERLFAGYPSPTEKIKALEALKFDPFSPFESVAVDALVIGNIESSAAEKLYLKVTTLLGTSLPKEKRWERKVLPFEENTQVIEKQVVVNGSCALVAQQLAPYTLKNMVAVEALSQMMSAPFFKELRTQQQTGYVVTNVQETVDDNIFLLFLIQSYTYSPKELQKRIAAFVKDYTVKIEETDFNATKNSLLERWSKDPDSFEAFAKEMQNFAFSENFNFNFTQDKLEALKSLTFEQFKEKAEEALQTKRRLLIEINN